MISDNPYFTAGFGLLGVGAVLASARTGAIRLFAIVQRRYLTTLEIHSRDPSYPWVTTFLGKLNEAGAMSSGSHFTLTAAQIGKQSAQLTQATQAKNEKYILTPAPGIHYFKWSDTWFKMERNREKSNVLTGEPYETISLTCIGHRSPAMTRFIDAVMDEGRRSEKGLLPVYTAFASDWRQFGPPRRPRLLNSVVLKEGQMESLLKDMQTFLAMGDWYADRGIPYRRGYLLHGPPGCGKSSAIQALAGSLGYGLAVMSLSDKSLSDDRIAYLFNNLPPKTLLLLEDIDCVVPKRSVETNVTLSGLLNVIDGAVAGEERIIFMTTNHPEHLDPALVRPGRIDVKVEIGMIGEEEQAMRMYQRFYGAESSKSKQKEFAKHCIGLSPAQVQGVFINYPDDPLQALECLKSLRVPCYHQGEDQENTRRKGLQA